MNKRKVLSIIFFVFFLVSLIFNVLAKFDEISVPYFKGIRRTVQTDIIFKDKKTNIFYDNKIPDTEIKIDENHYLFDTKTYKKISKINIENKNSIKNLLVFNEKQVKNYKVIPDDIEINNEKNILEKFSITFLSFFYNCKLFLITYLFFILFISFSNLKFNHKLTFILITILSVLFRITQINEIPFWDDEIYVLVHTDKFAKLIELFNDPGNPPLFFILFKIWRNIVQKEEFYRYLTLLFGAGFNIAFYFYIKTWLNKNKALVAYFAVAISLILIYFSQEIRCYALLMLLSVISSILLFKYSKKTKFLYIFNSILLLNTHFYGIFVWLFNFVFGASIFYKNKNKIKSFVLNNITAFLIFIPNILLKTKSLTSEFNNWILVPKIEDVLQVFKNFSVSNLIFGLFLVLIFYLYKKEKQTRKKVFLKYNILAIFSIIVFSFIFSYLIKPIFHYRYFYVTYPFYLALCTYVCCFEYKTVFKFFLQFVFFILFFTTGRMNTQNLYNNSDLYYNFVKSDIDSSKRNYVFFTNTVKNYGLYENNLKNKAEVIYLEVDKGISDINPKEQNIKTPCVCYFINLYLKNSVYGEASDIEIFKTPLGIITKVSYD